MLPDRAASFAPQTWDGTTDARFPASLNPRESSQTMEIQKTSRITRSHLLSRMVHEGEAEWRQLQCGIGNRGRALRATGTPVDSDSPFASCELRVFGALRVTYAAALQIAQ